jgi:hypothetical protein
VGPLADGEKWRCDCADNLAWLAALPTGYAALTFCSPPYESQRTYGIGYKLRGQPWVDWMIPRVVEMCRVTDGLVCVNMAGPVRGHSYQPVVEWLVADLTRRHGLVCGPSPYVYYRSGIPGSGSKHYHRRDWEPVYCFARSECLPLKWSDNTAMGHPPKWAPGGEMSNRRSDGQMVNQWGMTVRPDGSLTSTDPGRDIEGGEQVRRSVKPSHRVLTCGRSRRANGVKNRAGEPSAEERNPLPALANPGNVFQDRYTAEQVAALLGEPNDVIRCTVGGNHMGDPAAHGSEAPFSERLVEFFVRSYAPPESVVLDPFCGSGTTVSVSFQWGRLGHGCDVRQSQADLAARRMRNAQPRLFV